MCQIDDYTQALEYKLQEKQEHVQVNGYSSFKFLQCALPLQLFAVSGDNQCIVEPVKGEVRLCACVTQYECL